MYQMYPYTCILIYVNAGESKSQISSNFQGSWQSQNLLLLAFECDLPFWRQRLVESFFISGGSRPEKGPFQPVSLSFASEPTANCV